MKAEQFLYASEFLQLVSCEEVPLAWRRAIVLSVYLLLRQSELQALAWDDLDLEHGVAHVHERAGRPKSGRVLARLAEDVCAGLGDTFPSLPAPL